VIGKIILFSYVNYIFYETSDKMGRFINKKLKYIELK